VVPLPNRLNSVALGLAKFASFPRQGGQHGRHASVKNQWMHELMLWVGFNLFVLALLAVDLGLFHREAHEVSVREAAVWSCVWVALSLLFCLGIYRFEGSQAGLEFLTGYLIEKALSVDNIFVFVMVFAYFGVPRRYQHRILFWGILGALVLRGSMIATGAYLIHRFQWITYVFGAFLVVTAYRMATQDEEGIEPEANPVIHLVRRFMPVTHVYHGQRFFARESSGLDGRMRTVATPLLVVLVLVETTDVVFALDSIPAIFAVTRDPFLVYSSNVFAILGLRAMYFLLAGVIHRFHYLQMGLSVVLAFVGTKMLLAETYAVPIGISLGVVAAILALSVAASLVFPKHGEEAAEDSRASDGDDPPPRQAASGSKPS
jgi:TerC family integral membrane protein